MLVRRILGLAAINAAAVTLPACPKCPQGFHPIHIDYPSVSLSISGKDVARETHFPGGYDLKTIYTYRFTATGSATLRDDGPGGKARTRTFGPEGIENDKAADAPLPDFPLGALLVIVGGRPYWVGKGGLPMSFSTDSKLEFALNVPPGKPAGGSGIANPNTIDVSMAISVAVYHEECAKDDAPPPKIDPPPVPPKFADLYAKYFASGTAGNCVACHGAATGTTPNFGMTSDSMYDWLSGQGMFTGSDPRFGSMTTSPLKWCNPAGTMPKGSTAPAPAGACTEIRDWIARGAPR